MYPLRCPHVQVGERRQSGFQEVVAHVLSLANPTTALARAAPRNEAFRHKLYRSVDWAAAGVPEEDAPASQAPPHLRDARGKKILNEHNPVERTISTESEISSIECCFSKSTRHETEDCCTSKCFPKCL